jgi:hypothetical protein
MKRPLSYQQFSHLTARPGQPARTLTGQWPGAVKRPIVYTRIGEARLFFWRAAWLGSTMSKEHITMLPGARNTLILSILGLVGVLPLIGSFLESRLAWHVDGQIDNNNCTMSKEHITMKSEFQSQAPATHALAIVSLILSILGLVGVLPLIGSIGGIISGRIAQREILEKPDVHGGEGLARAGIVLGWVGVGLALLLCCVIVAGLLFFVPVRSAFGSIMLLPLF